MTRGRLTHSLCLWKIPQVIGGGGLLREPSNTAWLTQCNQSPTIQRDRDPGDRNAAPTWICMNVSRHDWVGGFCCENSFLWDLLQRDLKSILEKMIHSVIMCQCTAKRLFHLCVFRNTESRNAKQVLKVFRRGRALPHCLSTSLEYPYAPWSVALQRGALAVPRYKQL